MIWALAGAVVIGVALGLLGSGGSILTVPILVYLLHHEEKAAIAESLAIVGMISLVGAVRARAAGGFDLRSALLVGIPGMAGTLLGAYLAYWVPGALQLLLLAAVMLAAATGMFALRSAHPLAQAPAAGVVIAIGMGVGIITGLVGVGGGFLIIPALVLLLGLPVSTAIATSLGIIAMNSAVGFIKYQSVLESQGMAVNWTIVGLFIVLGILGAWSGSHLGSRLKAEHLRRVFAVFLVAMAAYILVREVPRLGPDPGPASPETAAAQ